MISQKEKRAIKKMSSVKELKSLRVSVLHRLKRAVEGESEIAIQECMSDVSFLNDAIHEKQMEEELEEV